MKFFRKKRLSSVIFLPLSVIFIAGSTTAPTTDRRGCDQDLVTTGCCASVAEGGCKIYCNLYCDRGPNNDLVPQCLCTFVKQNGTNSKSSDADGNHDLKSQCPELVRKADCKCMEHKCGHSCNLSCEATTTTGEAARIEPTQRTTANTGVPATTEEAATTESTQTTTTDTVVAAATEAIQETAVITDTGNTVTPTTEATIETAATATVETPAASELVQVAEAKIKALNVTEEGSLMYGGKRDVRDVRDASKQTSYLLLTSDGNALEVTFLTTKKYGNSSDVVRILLFHVTRRDGNKSKDAVDVITKLFKDLELVDKKRVRKNGSSVFVATQELETFAIEYSEIHYKANESRIIHTELYAMKIAKVPADTKTGVVFSLNETERSDKKGRNSIFLPREVFEGKDAVVVCIIYDYAKRWITQDEQIHLDDMNKALNFKLGSRIFAASVYPAPSGTLEENVTISFTQNNEFKKEDIPHCCFWDHSTLNGSWSSRGCSLVKSVNNEITCACNHLTNFAVLMQVSASKGVSSKHSLALAVITYIGCALSLTGEVLTIVIYCVLMNLKQEQIQIRFNLAVAIAIAQIAFLSGIGATETESVCVSVAALIHFFYLAGFAWMLFEGAYLYLMVIKVFNTAVRMHVLYAVAWGVPAVIVALSIAIASSGDGGVHSYVHGDLCWLSFNNYLIWTFVAPVLLVCLANSVVLGLVLREILKMQSHNASEREKLMQGTKAFFVLFPLLGMTWVFGVLSVTDAGLVFQYIFTILNSLQGFLIFILHVVRNGDVRAEFKRKKRMWKDARSIKASLCSRQDQSNTWTNKAVKIDAHELGGIANEAATCSDASTGYDNAFVFYNENSIAPVDM